MINRRHGYTLIELVVGLSMGSTLMVLAIGVVHQAMSFSSLGHEREQRNRSVTRLSHQFRVDVRQARNHTFEQSELTLSMDDQSIVVYSLNDDRVVRSQEMGDETQRIEYYALGRSQAILSAETDPNRVGLVIQTDTRIRGAQPRVDRQIMATVGATWRQPQ